MSYETPVNSELCDSQLATGWYRFVGAAGTIMPTTRVPAFRCGTKHSGWLKGAHPTVKDREVTRQVCFSDTQTSGCKTSATVSVKNCGLYFIYKLKSPACFSRFCATDWLQRKQCNAIRTLIYRSSDKCTLSVFRHIGFFIFHESFCTAVIGHL